MVEFTIKISRDGARRLIGTIGRRRSELTAIIARHLEDDSPRPEKSIAVLSELNQIDDAIRKALDGVKEQRNKLSDKQPPIDRGKLLIALECCRNQRCRNCPYRDDYDGCPNAADATLAYICWLEDQLEEAGKA